MDNLTIHFDFGFFMSGNYYEVNADFLGQYNELDTREVNIYRAEGVADKMEKLKLQTAL